MSGSGRAPWRWEDVLRNQSSAVPLWHEPARAAAAVASAAIVVAAFLPYAQGWIPDARGAPRPMTWSGFEGSADGGILLSLALIAGFLALHRGVAESPNQIAQLAPLVVGALAAFTALNALHEASGAVAEWQRSNGDGELGLGMHVSILGAIVLLASGAWVGLTAARRPADASDQLRVSLSDVAEGVGALVGGVGGFMAALIVASSRLDAVYTPLMLLASLLGGLGGILLGARAGVTLVERLRRRRDRSRDPQE